MNINVQAIKGEIGSPILSNLTFRFVKKKELVYNPIISFTNNDTRSEDWFVIHLDMSLTVIREEQKKQVDTWCKFQYKVTSENNWLYDDLKSKSLLNIVLDVAYTQIIQMKNKVNVLLIEKGLPQVSPRDKEHHRHMIEELLKGYFSIQPPNL